MRCVGLSLNRSQLPYKYFVRDCVLPSLSLDRKLSFALNHDPQPFHSYSRNCAADLLFTFGDVYALLSHQFLARLFITSHLFTWGGTNCLANAHSMFTLSPQIRLCAARISPSSDGLRRLIHCSRIHTFTACSGTWLVRSRYLLFTSVSAQTFWEWI